MLRRFFAWFRSPPSIEEFYEPPFDLLFGGYIGDKPERIIGEDRFRIGIFPAFREGKPDPHGTSTYWLDIQFRSKRKWTSMLVMPEGKLDVVRDVLYEVSRYLDEQQNRPRRLPTIRLGNRRFYIDQRLSQLRNVDDPDDFYDIR